MLRKAFALLAGLLFASVALSQPSKTVSQLGTCKLERPQVALVIDGTTPVDCSEGDGAPPYQVECVCLNGVWHPSSNIPHVLVQNLPVCIDGGPMLFYVTDGASGTDCSTGLGTTTVPCSCEDGVWAALGSGSGGDVVGPGSATDNAIARFDGTTGKLIQNSGATIDDSGNATTVGVTATGAVNFSGASQTKVVEASSTLPAEPCASGEWYRDDDSGGSETYICGADLKWHKILTETGGWHGAVLYHSTTQSIANATNVERLYDTEIYDSDGYHSTSSNTARITIPTGLAGKYYATCTVRYAAHAAGTRDAQLWKNGTSSGTSLEVNRIGASAVIDSVSTSALVDLVAGDYVVCVANQNSGGALNTSSSGQLGSFSMYLLTAPGSGGSEDHGVRVRKTDQTVNNTTADLTWESEDQDTDAYHDNSTNNERLTVPVGLAGTYIITCGTYWTAALQRPVVRLEINDTNFLPGNTGYYTSGVALVSTTWVLPLVAGDYIKCVASTVGSTVVDGDQSSTTFGMYKIAGGSSGDPGPENAPYGQYDPNNPPASCAVCDEFPSASTVFDTWSNQDGATATAEMSTYLITGDGTDEFHGRTGDAPSAGNTDFVYTVAVWQEFITNANDGCGIGLIEAGTEATPTQIYAVTYTNAATDGWFFHEADNLTLAGVSQIGSTLAVDIDFSRNLLVWIQFRYTDSTRALTAWVSYNGYLWQQVGTSTTLTSDPEFLFIHARDAGQCRFFLARARTDAAGISSPFPAGE